MESFPAYTHVPRLLRGFIAEVHSLELPLVYICLRSFSASSRSQWSSGTYIVPYKSFLWIDCSEVVLVRGNHYQIQ